MTSNYLFTSESVSAGHPDKLADQISDSVLDEVLKFDPFSRVAAETLCTKNLVILAGEITTSATVDYAEIARQAIRNVGYTNADTGINPDTCEVQVRYIEQSPDIKIGVDTAYDDENELGAGDQGIMFGYATDETDSFLPAPIHLAHSIVRQQEKVFKNKIIDWLQPDAKSQVTLKYVNNIPVSIDTVVLSTQHLAGVNNKELHHSVIEHIIKPVLPAYLDTTKTRFLINPTGSFIIGGPAGDCGLTGRKIIVDTYGGAVAHGGGAFSGKDPSKVDRSAAYQARHIAKNIVANGLARKCLVQLSYAIGVAYPTSIFVYTFGTSEHSNSELIDLIWSNFKLTPKGIINELDLLRPIYAQTASGGHFGRNDIELPWEQIKPIRY